MIAKDEIERLLQALGRQRPVRPPSGRRAPERAGRGVPRQALGGRQRLRRPLPGRRERRRAGRGAHASSRATTTYTSAVGSPSTRARRPSAHQALGRQRLRRPPSGRRAPEARRPRCSHQLSGDNDSDVRYRVAGNAGAPADGATKLSGDSDLLYVRYRVAGNAGAPAEVLT